MSTSARTRRPRLTSRRIEGLEILLDRLPAPKDLDGRRPANLFTPATVPERRAARTAIAYLQDLVAAERARREGA